jgi:hypothetical protein
VHLKRIDAQVPNLRASSHPRVIYTSQDGLAVGELSAVCLVVWRGAVERTLFEHQRAALAEVVQRNPDGAGFLCLVEETAKPPDDELRRASTQMVAAHGRRLRCVACVIEGSGFKAAVTRSVLSGMALLLTRQRTPISFFSHAPPAAKWMREHMPIDSVDDIAAGVDALRALLPRPHPSP